MKHHFKWFLALSVAAHAVALFAWVVPIPEAGNPGQVLLLDVTDKTGQVASLTANNSGNRHRETDVTTGDRVLPHKPVYTTRNTINEQTGGRNTNASNVPRSISSGEKRMEPGSLENLAASSPLPSQQESDRHLRSSVLELVTQRLSYPAIARRKGWQGVVTLKLRIESDGLISSLQVNETSGYPALDRAAMKSLQLASIPGARHWLHGRSIDMLVPVEYRLLDS